MAADEIEIEIDGTIFSFPHHWRVEVFDEWPQYRDVSGTGQIHGCDVVALDGSRLWLIEVKDYSYPGARSPQNIDEVLLRKAVGTLALLSALGRSKNQSPAHDFSVDSLRAQEIYLTLHVEPSAQQSRRTSAGPLMAYRQKAEWAARRLHLAKGFVTSSLTPNPRTPWTSRRDPATRDAHLQP